MITGTQFRQGDIVLVLLPFTDLTMAKQRPAIIVSNNTYNTKVEDLVVCGITSNLQDEEYSIMIEQKDMSNGIIHFISKIKVDKIFTLSKNIIRKKLGTIKPEVLIKVKQELNSLFS